MKHILLPDNRPRRLVFYLAMEEYVARHLNEKECFFIWQVAPTVIFGRNQVLEAEVNLPYCNAHDIAIFRRKSGGGCVYSDLGNIMLSYIKEGDQVGFIFDTYMRRIAFLLQKMGIPAEVSGRNDILIGGRKVSGNAFYQLPGKSIVHGTMLFNTNFDHLEQAITPSSDKLRSKGVASARQRVTNLTEHTTIDIETFKQHLITSLCNEERVLTAEEVAAIEEIESTYLDDDFIYGIELKGDFFVLQDYAQELHRRLRGRAFDRHSMQEALQDWSLENHIKDLTTQELLDIIFKN